jgi:hypothetical protein
MSFEFAPFVEFLGSLSVNTKEYGSVRLGNSLMGSQARFFEELQRGLANEQHEFIVLKARQLGISTAMLALDMYYPQKYAGTPGTIITHDEPARQQFRATLEVYYAGLPPEWQIPIVQHNRDQLVFENGSMLQYKVAGLKETSKKVLGRSSAVSFAHCTEVAYWGDPQQIDGLKSAMAEKNPLRLYVWESTANGFNHFYEMWEEAKQSVTIKPIFIGWWAKEDYRVAREGKIWRQYWGFKGRATQAERDTIKQLMELYDVELDDEQLAWYRWLRAEKITDEMSLLKDYPSLPEEAFVASGSKYFTGQHLSEAYRRVLGEPRAQTFRLQCGAEFTDTTLADVNDRIATLRVWAEPEAGGFYVLGADPAYGSSADADRYCATVLRCYANRIEQVAEFCTVDIAPYTFAWVIVYLAGCYQPCLTNIEINGSGSAVIQEIENLRRMSGRVPRGLEHQKHTMRDVIRRMSDYLYAREDSITGRPMGKHTITTERVKESYMGLLKDNFERGIFVPHSRFLLDEMKTIVRDEGSICAQGDAKDDRVIASALAVKAWNDSLRMAMVTKSIVWLPPEERKALESRPPDGVLPRVVRNYLVSVGALHKPQPINPNIKTYIPRGP